ncbi:ETX/MTX2 family pore-forming toxin [Bacillus cereus]|nr:ETX/MTX2 family pore-forming toxin [Bacillus cereus]
MKKRKILCSSIIFSTLLGGSTLGNTVSAAETSIKKDNISNFNSFYQQKTLEDIDSKINNMTKAMPNREKWYPEIVYPDDAFKVSGINIKENNVTNITPLFLGRNIFQNDTNQDQTYNTASFSQAVTETTSTATQVGFKTSPSAKKGRWEFPF